MCQLQPTYRAGPVGALCLAVAACTVDDAITAAATIAEVALATKIEALADDSMLGRGPASLGEERTLRYLEQQFRAVGLEPGNGARYLQEVPRVSITAAPP